MAENHPLAGLKILVTRPRDQAAKLAGGIEQAGGVAVLFPLLEITALQDGRALQEQVSRLAQFDLAIFISPNAVRFGMAAIREQTVLPDSLRIATVGQGSAKALRELGITSVIAPAERFDSEGLLALPEFRDVAGWRVLIFRGDGGRELLGDTLKARGAAVEYATCYQRSKPPQPAGHLLEIMPDAIIVTSSEALGYLWEMLDAAARMSLCGVPLFLPHARIAELAVHQGWQRVLLANSGDDGMLAALVGWAGRQRHNQTPAPQSLL